MEHVKGGGKTELKLVNDGAAVECYLLSLVEHLN